MVMLPVVVFQVKRNREEELIHRGVQYSRAMKHFVKKFGRYPTRLEELENTNQVRFLRKRYKDPITGKDFKLLHVGEVQMSFGAGIPGATPAGGLNPSAAGINGAPGAPSGPGGQAALANGALNTFAAAGGLAAAAGANAGNFAQATSPNTAVTQIPGQPSNDNSESEPPGAGPNQGGSFAAAGPGTPGAFGSVNAGNSPNPQVFR